MKEKIFSFFREYWKKLVLVSFLALACVLFDRMSFNTLEYLIRDNLQYLNSTNKIDKSLVTLTINTFTKHGIRHPHTLNGFKKIIDKLQETHPRAILIMMEPLDLLDTQSNKKEIFNYFASFKNIFLNKVESRNGHTSFSLDPIFKDFPNFIEIELCQETDKKSRRAMISYNNNGPTPLIKDLRKLGLNPKEPTFYKFGLEYWETKQGLLKSFELGTYGNYQSDSLLADEIPGEIFRDKVVIIGTNDEYSFLYRNSTFNTFVKKGQKSMSGYIHPFQDVVANVINFHTSGDYIKLLGSVNDLLVTFFLLVTLIFVRTSILNKAYLFLALAPTLIIFEVLFYFFSSFYIDISRSIALLVFLQYLAVPIFMFFYFKSQESKKLLAINDARIDSLLLVSERVAHDIRSPLSAINLILSKVKIENAEYKEIINNSLNRIDETAGQILTKYKTTTGVAKIFLEPIDICEMICSLISEKKIIDPKIQYSFNNTVEEQFYILGYKLELESILSNILDNAIFALKNKDVTPEILVQLVRNKAILTIQITDNGIGIPDGILVLLGKDRITTKRRDNGNGIGLLHAKRTIERMNGSFIVKSEENRFTTVTLTLGIM